MQKIWGYIRPRLGFLSLLALASAIVAWLLLYRLGTLTTGLNANEAAIALQPVGWHGIYRHPLYLPLQIIRSVVFRLAPAHGAFLTRLPNALWGGLTILIFGFLVRLWHGTRTTALATILFACAAWTLHVSRLASSDVLYLGAIPTLLLTQTALPQHFKQPVVWYGSLLAYGVLLYIPGLVWLVVPSIWLQRQALWEGWEHFKLGWQRTLSVFLGVAWLPLLILDLLRAGQLRLWLGLPQHFATPFKLLKQFIGVFVHLFLRGPQYPDMWLGRLPILDVFSLVMFLLGGYFYARRWQAKRSRTIALFSIISIVLVALNGPVGLSLLVPILYLSAATGIAFLSHEWLKVFPNNPLARSLGIALVSLAVASSCIYNYRAYFVAWPHSPTTTAIFTYQKP